MLLRHWAATETLGRLSTCRRATRQMRGTRPRPDDAAGERRGIGTGSTASWPCMRHEAADRCALSGTRRDGDRLGRRPLPSGVQRGCSRMWRVLHTIEAERQVAAARNDSRWRATAATATTCGQRLRLRGIAARAQSVLADECLVAISAIDGSRRLAGLVSAHYRSGTMQRYRASPGVACAVPGSRWRFLGVASVSTDEYAHALVSPAVWRRECGDATYWHCGAGAARDDRAVALCRTRDRPGGRAAESVSGLPDDHRATRCPLVR